MMGLCDELFVFGLHWLYWLHARWQRWLVTLAWYKTGEWGCLQRGGATRRKVWTLPPVLVMIFSFIWGQGKAGVLGFLISLILFLYRL